MRSGYVDDMDYRDLALYRGRVTRALRGKRGQAFLHELLNALDALPRRQLIAEELIDKEGNCCAIGAVCKTRGVNVAQIDYDNPEAVGLAVGIAESMAAEIEFVNDDDFGYRKETSSARWVRVRKWVTDNILVP